MGSRKVGTMVRLAEAAAGPRAGCRVGWIAGVDGRGLLVDFDGNASGPLTAECAVHLERREIDEAIAARRRAVLLFDGDDASRPVLVGLVQPTAGAALLAEVLSPPPARSREAVVDGRRVVIEGRDEVVLRCGEASITLQKDGKVVVRGLRITSTARGTHRIRGGSVQIN
jgi:uncharacterized protein DUF6484